MASENNRKRRRRKQSRNANRAKRQSNAVKFMFTWIASTERDYQRGIDLGIIDGWTSWYAYKSHFTSYIASLPSNVKKRLVLLEASPDAIVARLEKEGLENNSENRCSVFAMMGMESLRNASSGGDKT